MLLVVLFFIELKEVVVDATTIIHTTVSGLQSTLTCFMTDKKQTDKKKRKNYGQSYSMESSGIIDSLKSTMEHLHQYKGQLALFNKGKPATATLAAIAASICSSSILNPNSFQAVDLAQELWSADRPKSQVELEPDDF